MSEAPAFVIHKFGTDLKKLDSGEWKERDWIEYSPLGGAQYSRIREYIDRLQPIPSGDKRSNNPAVQMATARWAFIEPRYQAWKKGQTAPVDGTSLVVWNGISESQRDILKMQGVHTVEELSKLTDTHIDRFRLPGLRNIIENAKRFLTTLDKDSVSKELEKKDAQIAALSARLEELAAAVIPKRGPGRPPKVRPEQSAVA